MRCYAFAQTCRRLGHRATFLSAGDAPEGRTRLAAARITAVKLSASHPDRADVAETVRWARTRRGSWLVVDGYRFDADYQRRLHEAGCRFIAIDDDAFVERYYADVILNQNLFAERLKYRCAGEPRLLLGLRYALIRREVRRQRAVRRRTASCARRVLVTFGGTDPRRQTGKVIQALRGVGSPLDVRVALGPGAPRDDVDGARPGRARTR